MDSRRIALVVPSIAPLKFVVSFSVTEGGTGLDMFDQSVEFQVAMRLVGFCTVGAFVA